MVGKRRWPIRAGDLAEIRLALAEHRAVFLNDFGRTVSRERPIGKSMEFESV
jgi:hypothetical protein